MEVIIDKNNYSDFEDYICVNSETSIQLHKKGFQPIFRNLTTDEVYYVKTDEIVEYIEFLGKGGKGNE